MAKFTPRPRKQRDRARLASEQPSASHDTNAFEIIPESKTAAQARKAQMRAELMAQNAQTSMSSKKRKRLDKYIDTKLKKQDNLELIKKLGAHRIDTSLLRSSKKLGRSGDSTKRESLAQALNEQRSGIKTKENEGLLFEQRGALDADHVPFPGFEEAEGAGEAKEAATKLIVPNPASEQPQSGGGLKRPLQLDEEGNPMIQPRKRHKVVARRRIPIEPIEGDFEDESEAEASEDASEDSEESWEGCGTSVEEDDNAAGDDTPGTEGDSSSQSESDTESNGDEARQERTSAFKAWAQSQRNAAVGFKPSHAAIAPANGSDSGRSQPVSQHVDGLRVGSTHPASQAKQPIIPAILSNSIKRAIHVPIKRPPEVDISRQDLPVVAKEQEVMETVSNNDMTILTGTTGSGKTTQVPQFLFEAGYGDAKSSTPGMIGITQPRRVAAVSMAKRVSYEMGDLGQRVSHQVRFDSSVSARTSVKFMTDGVLLREVSQDFTLSKYSVIIVDEAHERSVNTDILIGMLSRIVETRRRLSDEKKSSFKPLKVIIMSATLRVAELKENKDLFRGKQPPVIDVEGKQYSVASHFARKTQRDYVNEMYQKVSRGHRKLPPGGMLVFMTGQNEIEHLERRLKADFPCTETATPFRPKMHISAFQTTVEDDDIDVKGGQHHPALDAETRLSGLGGDDGDVQDYSDFDIADEGASTSKRVHVLPLYSQLSAEQQALVFEPPPTDSRLIILATNVAETSITIPNIRYVFDTGRAKAKQYSPGTGVQTFAIDWISKASAQQRAGRAGRTGSGGHCYRLYSSAIYEDAFPAFSDPEITQTPIEGVVLQLKSMGIPDITRFPFPTPLAHDRLWKAERLLQYLGGLENGTNKVTNLGQQLSVFPISPRLAKILVLAEKQPNMVQHALGLAALLAIQEVFVSEAQLGLKLEMLPSMEAESTERVWSHADSEKASRRESLKSEYSAFHGRMARQDKYSDAVKLLTALTQYTTTAGKKHGSDPAFHTLGKFTRIKSLKEASQLRAQLASLVSLRGSNAAPPTTNLQQTPLSPPSSAQALALRQIVAAGYIDNLALRADLSPTPPASKQAPSSAVQVPYVTLFPSTQHALPKSAMEALDNKGKDRLHNVYIHPSSVLAHVSPQKLPQFIVYSHLSTSSPLGELLGGGVAIPRTRMHPLSPVPADAIKELVRGTPLFCEGKPIGKIEALKRNEAGEERRCIWSVPFVRSGSEMEGGREWPLPPARKVVQVRKARRGWVEEGA